MDTSSIQSAFVALFDGVFPTISAHSTLYSLLAISTLFLIAFFIHIVSQLLIKPQLEKWVKKSQIAWDDALLEHGFFNRLFHLLPALILYLSAPVLLTNDNVGYHLLNKISLLYMMFSALLTVYAALNTAEDTYYESSLAQRGPITGFIQVIKLFLAILTLLLSVSLLIERSPLILLSGLTAIAAVLLLIFRDTILGLVAGIQIAANRMFNNGDWIQIDKFGVDGEIIEIGLTNVKVQNWDKTIATLPTHSLTTESVKNWRGMSESGGRRIKRAVYIDIHSVKLCDQTMLDSFSNIRFISDYIDGKLAELQQHNTSLEIDEDDLLNSRKLTNLGTFRAYVAAYLQQHPDVNHSMTCMVRQLASSELGIPLELYCFSNKKEWVIYEGIQADIFDHVFAMLPLFGLRAYQRDTNQTNN